MKDLMEKLQSPLFEGIDSGNLRAMLGCLGYHVGSFRKGGVIAFEDENILHIGIILSGAVDMVKEDLWGNKTMLLRMRKTEMFGETFACSLDTQSTANFVAAEDAEILFLPFRRVMHTCDKTCQFHHRLIENMVHLIAAKNRDLLRKVEVISRKTLREKILAYLSMQAQVQGTRYPELPLSRAELADYLCADRSALSRELSAMRAEGLIDYHKNMFRIL